MIGQVTVQPSSAVQPELPLREVRSCGLAGGEVVVLAWPVVPYAGSEAAVHVGNSVKAREALDSVVILDECSQDSIALHEADGSAVAGFGPEARIPVVRAAAAPYHIPDLESRRVDNAAIHATAGICSDDGATEVRPTVGTNVYLDCETEYVVTLIEVAPVALSCGIARSW